MPSRRNVHETEVVHTPARRRRAEDAPLLPHDRDEAVGATAGVPSPEVQQAHRDLQRGLRDTDRGPVADRAYRQLKDGREAQPPLPSGPRRVLRGGEGT